MRFKRQAAGYIWCNHHCSIHLDEPDFYEEGATECQPANWRRVFVETDDATETFS